MAAQPKQPLDQQKRWQCAGNQQEIVEVKSQKRTMNVWPDEPAIESVKRTRQNEKSVAEVTKPFHRANRITYPKAMATISFSARIMFYFVLRDGSRNCLFLA